MITNLTIIVFIGLLALAFSNYGLFSGFIHLVLTLCAGAIAFALWEPLTLNYLINRMPDYAWGIGLLAPFVLALLLLRTAGDWLIPGNVDFHNIANMVGGGFFGVIAGIFTTGILVIGLQFITGFNLPGYTPYGIEVNGHVKRVKYLLIPVDDIAGSTFTSLSGGAFLPWSGKTMDRYQPDIVRAAGTYQLGARQGARNSVQPDNVTISRYFELPNQKLPQSFPPPPPSEDNAPSGVKRPVVIGASINLTGGEGLGIAADTDGTFTASRAQITLIAMNDSGQSTVIHPTGYVVRDHYGTLTDHQEYVRSMAAVSEESFDFLFHVPDGFTPRYLTLKRTRFDLPDKPDRTEEEIAQWLTTTVWVPDPTVQEDPTEDTGSTEMTRSRGAGVGVEGYRISIDANLPSTLSKNWLISVSSRAQFDDDNRIIQMNGTVTTGPGQYSRNLAISAISHPDNTAIIKVQLAPERARQYFGRAVQAAAQLHPPVLRTDRDTFEAIGWVRDGNGVYEMNIDTTQTIRSLTEVNINNLRDGDELVLYFRVPKGVTITQFQVARTTQDVNVVVPR